ncbi:hypothetical protein NL676_002203 [Syzygium grande]|nr:hypothetical protein NL676_002203 [Syzygium grande]
MDETAIRRYIFQSIDDRLHSLASRARSQMRQKPASQVVQLGKDLLSGVRIWHGNPPLLRYAQAAAGGPAEAARSEAPIVWRLRRSR